MYNDKSQAPRMIERRLAAGQLLRSTGAAVLVVTTLALASCGSMHRDNMSTSSVPDDYRTRHPITLAEVQHDLDVPVGTGETRLTDASRDLIKGFAQDYAALSSSTMQILVPDNAVNSGAAFAIKGQIRKTLIESGVRANRVILSSYTPTAANVSAPVRLRFVAVTAITDECGQWPSDLNGPSVTNNTNWENFGCSTQQNLAAQIANPVDLVGPRGMTPIDAQRRAEVITTYRSDGSGT